MRNLSTLILTIMTSLIFLTACEDQSEEDSSCRYYVQQDLDNQDYDSALERLESTTCQDTYPDDEYLVDRASAYLGKAGFTFVDILGAAISEDDEDGSDDALSAFTSSIAELNNEDTIEYLELAEADYTDYLNDTCNDIGDKTTSQEGVCLIQGVLSLSKTAIALDFLSGGGDLAESETLDLSACALQHSVGSPVTDCTVVTDTVQFTNIEGTVDKTYTLLTMTADGNSEYFLETTTGTTIQSIVFTDGFCTNNFTKKDAVTENIHTTTLASDEISYICPSEESDDESVNDFVLDAINDAIKNISSLAETIGVGASDEEVSDIQESIDEFKGDILGCGVNCTDAQLDADLDIDNIISYLNTLDN